MSEQDFFRREIDRTKLPKKALNVLAKCNKLADFYQRARSEVDVIHITSDDYRILNDALQKTDQNLHDRVYRGFRLEVNHG